MSNKRCYSVKELQQILGLSRSAVYALLKKNEFRYLQIGSRYVISKISFDKWLDGEFAAEDDEEYGEFEEQSSQKVMDIQVY